MHTYIHKHTHTHISHNIGSTFTRYCCIYHKYACIHTDIHTYIHTYIYTCTNTYIHTSCIHTYIHTDRQTDRQEADITFNQNTNLPSIAIFIPNYFLTYLFSESLFQKGNFDVQNDISVFVTLRTVILNNLLDV